jgi:hypothetical protein
VVDLFLLVHAAIDLIFVVFVDPARPMPRRCSWLPTRHYARSSSATHPMSAPPLDTFPATVPSETVSPTEIGIARHDHALRSVHGFGQRLNLSVQIVPRFFLSSKSDSLRRWIGPVTDRVGKTYRSSDLLAMGVRTTGSLIKVVQASVMRGIWTGLSNTHC